MSVPYVQDTADLLSSLHTTAHGIKEILQAMAELYASVATEAGLPVAKYLLLITYVVVLMAVHTPVCILA